MHLVYWASSLTILVAKDRAVSSAPKMSSHHPDIRSRFVQFVGWYTCIVLTMT